MSPELYFQILFCLINNNKFAQGFSLIDLFASNPDVLRNIGSQLLGYSVDVLTERLVQVNHLLPLIISYASPALDFIKQSSHGSKAEKVATIVFLFSGSGFLVKTGDPVLNLLAETFISLLAQYIESMSKSGGGNNILFISVSPNRSLKQFTIKQQIQCDIAILSIIILVVGTLYGIIFIVRKSNKFIIHKLKSSKSETKFIIKRFKCDQKVKFISLPEIYN